MRKLNGRNKIFIIIFSIIVVVMIVILVSAVGIAQKNGSTVYSVSNNSIVFDSETNLIDTSKGGSIKQRWNGTYYYLDINDVEYELGDIPVVYEKSKDKIEIFGQNYLVNKDGSIIEGEEFTEITNYSETQFYKLADREYLIVSPEIYTEDKSIYASKYLLVYLDKKGNASVLNDSINLKTINPLTLVFDKYKFDIANEKLLIDTKNIDLKQVIGSTNEYKEKEHHMNDEVDLDYENLADQYNSLVESFQQYIDDSTLFIDAANTIFANANFNVTNSIVQGTTNSGNTANNLTNITKMVSLRGAIANSTHIDVTYAVSDVGDQYQVVYLLVTGIIDGEETTEKVLLDKYGSTYRIPKLSPRHEYTISLGYIERVKDLAGEWILQDQVEDTINVRTIKPDISIKIDKISKGYVHFTFKMKEEYALEGGSIALYAGDQYINRINIKTLEALSEKGFSSKMKLAEGSILELRLEDAIYNGNLVELNVKEKFTY
ncbi:MAG: hypothetical protein E7171_02320 [Firmicutes bacterium]|nr:hypothetical protein [Bacillota bacterium]